MESRSLQGGSRFRPALISLVLPLLLALLTPPAIARGMHGSGGGHGHGAAAGGHQFNRGSGHSAGMQHFNRGPGHAAGGHQFNRGPGHAAGGHHFNRGPGHVAGGHHSAWRGGHWHHGSHHGHIGWWWVAGGLWYPYAAPIYPYPYAYPYEPAAVLSEPAYDLPPPVQMWYFCDAAGAYYPHVANCPGGWREVPATVQPAP